MQPQELESSSLLLSSSPRETDPVLHAFMHLSKEAKRQYPRGLRLLFDYLKIPAGDLEERAQVFYIKLKRIHNRHNCIAGFPQLIPNNGRKHLTKTTIL